MKRSHIYLVTSALLMTFLQGSLSEKILLVPLPHWAHVNMFGAQGKALMLAGHDVSMVTVDLYGDKIKSDGIKPFLFHSEEHEEMENTLIEMAPKLVTGEVTFAEIIHTVLEGKLDEIVRNILQNQQLLKRLEDERFDLAIVDGFIPFRCIYSLPYRLSLKHVTLTALVDPWAAGVTSLPSVEPIPMIVASDDMSFTERAKNTFITLIFKVRGFLLFSIKKVDNYVEKYMPDREIISTDAMHQSSLFWFVNIETHCVDYPRLSGPNYKFIGGSSAKTPKPLPKEIADFIAGAEHGVVAMSFGSAKGFAGVITVLKDMFIDAFGRLKQRVIFQCDSKKFGRLPANMMCVDWLPQNDILGHPKTVLFISHGGNNGQIEAIHHGVPILTIPLTPEQAYNGNRMVSHGYGLMLDTQTMNADGIVEAVDTITSDSSYQENVTKCSKIMQDFPSATDTLVFWVNHILKFGGSHLRPRSADLPMYKLYNWDIAALIIFIVFNVIHLLIHLIIYIVQRCRRNKQKKE